MPPTLFTAAEVCARLHISARTLRRRLAEHRGIRPSRPGRVALFTEADVAQLVEACRDSASESPAPTLAASSPPASARARSVRRKQIAAARRRLVAAA